LIGAVAGSVLLQAEQADQPARLGYDGQPASSFALQPRGRGSKRILRPGSAADERAESRDRCVRRCGRGQVLALDRRQQPSVCCDDQGHVVVIVGEKLPDGR
jgi:hypothetical protein